jgi:hypothetical protein
MHRDSAFREYLEWFQSVTRTKLRQRWTDVDYAEIGSLDDDNSTYDTHTHVGSHVQLALVLDHVVSFLSIFLGFGIVVLCCFLTYMDCFRVAMFKDL